MPVPSPYMHPSLCSPTVLFKSEKINLEDHMTDCPPMKVFGCPSGLISTAVTWDQEVQTTEKCEAYT